MISGEVVEEGMSVEVFFLVIVDSLIVLNVGFFYVLDYEI